MSSSDVKATSRMLRAISDPHVRRLFELTLLNIDILKDSVGLLEDPLSLEWFDVILLNGWDRLSDEHAPPQFLKTNEGIVILRGHISGGTATSGTPLFNVPKEYRSEFEQDFVVHTNAGTAEVGVQTNGDITIESGTALHLALDGVFYVAYR